MNQAESVVLIFLVCGLFGFIVGWVGGKAQGRDDERARRTEAEPLAWMILTHGIPDVRLSREGLGLLAGRYAFPLVAADPWLHDRVKDQLEEQELS